MKQLLLLLLFPIAGLGQTDTAGRYLLLDTAYQISVGQWVRMPAEKTVMDTARVMIFYGDTSMVDGGLTKMRFGFAVWRMGYEVYEKIYVGEMNDPNLSPGSLIWRPISAYNHKHIAYLDEKKKPLLKNIVVIQTIKL